MSGERVTHAALVERAASWLRNTRKCGVVVTEAAGGHEIPDAIGWRCGGRVSILVEVKVTRRDFLKDRQKWHRVHDDQFGIGQERFYMTPPGLIRPDEVRPGWGLVEIGATGRARVVVRPPACGTAEKPLDREVMAREIGYLYSAVWKTQNERRPNGKAKRPQAVRGQPARSLTLLPAADEREEVA